MSIEENVKMIKNTIEEKVTLIAVSKTKPVEEIKKVYDIGIKDFGENKVQELVDKYDKLPKDIKWHLIGHLQRNKVKYIVGKVDLIQSLDSVRLLQEIEKQYSIKDEIAKVLIQINIGREESKTGILLDDLGELLEQCESCNNVKVKGLMAIIPKGTEESCKCYFMKMKNIFEDLKKKSFKNIQMDILSMGMSSDYLMALQEGSNMVRVGQGIFGKRNYNI
ncbi:YggS family pyridoxal phosphate-dependent enzyme [Clostridium sp. P21]|uniref:Pyridoxal phosphate homeostasis protein n=1 Tax=Clostridium muellerianum TaxID=2716538 RepID=A0A7Y0EDC5_9CLOT|nr:YggS family pyridoxal phosphate-dependent enzyme [Clostridium muellerianum]NMM61414.1 YggS family pyridoxal phosphate-dependent enzyme [Clostridium muellerianum]